jgi:hypothetical protein
VKVIVKLTLLAALCLNLSGCWWWWFPGPPHGSGGTGGTTATGGSSGSGGSSGTGGSVVCQNGDTFELTCIEVPGGSCGGFSEPDVFTLPLGPDESCEPAERPVNECVLELDRVCGPPEQFVEQTLTAELWDGGTGSMTLVIVDELNNFECTSEYTCSVDKL